MNYSDFFDRLGNVAYSYDWEVTNGKVNATIHSGPNKGKTLNPITALAHKSGLGVFNNTRDETESAVQLLGLTRKLARQIYSATLGTSNRGNTQVVRGKIRSALEV